MDLWPHEDVVPHVQAQASTEVGRKVVAAGVVRAAGETAGKDLVVEAYVFEADATLDFGLSPFAQGWSPYRVDVEKNRTERLEELVYVLMGAPGHFRADAKMLPEQKVAAKTRISSAAEALRGMRTVVDLSLRGIGSRVSFDRPVTECDIELLSGCRTG